MNAFRKLIKAATVPCRKTAPTTGKTQGIIANATDPVFGLPVSAPRNAKASAQRMVYCMAEEMLCGGRRNTRFVCRDAKEQTRH
jgi:hypothetical protein